MHLLKIGSRGELSLTDDLLKDIPPYAILSHTWGPDKEEVTFKDISDGSGRDKTGYIKIQFCADQARKDGLEHIWVDTACIDKTNLVQLSEAIVSMFKWYANAEKCYVFLSDVSSPKRDSAENTGLWEPALRECKWFTRGWTLQELLAPKVVEFYSREGVRVGDKRSLERTIVEVTGIPETALRGRSLSEFTHQERMGWASKRQTTRIEDRAYCLLGIFDVSMPVVYGEEQKAFHRLKDELARSYRWQLEAFDQDSPVSQSCGATAQDSKSVSHQMEESLLLEQRASLLESLGFLQMDSRRSTIENAYSTTCKWLLRHPAYLEWIDPQQSQQHYRILWINGKPGAGKSTLVKFALANARTASPDTEILLSFFFNARGHDLEKSTTGMYRALLFQLLTQVADLQKLLDDKKYSSDDGVKAYEWTVDSLCELLSSAIAKLGQRHLRCFIDALDEGDEEQIREMIDFFESLGQVALKSGSKLSICFASRHYPTIEVRSGRQVTLENERGHTEDVSKYIQHHLRAGKGKFIEEIKAEVQEKANGVFLWAVLVVKILNDEFRRGRIPAVKKRLQEIPPRLSELFKDLLRRDCANMDDLLLCLQWILFAARPLKLEEFYFAMWAGLEPESEDLAAWDSSHITVDDMQHFLVNSSKGLVELTKSSVPTVEFIHESVRDFLLKENGLREIWPELGDDLYSLGHDRLKRCCQAYMTVDISKYTTHDLETPTDSLAFSGTTQDNVTTGTFDNWMMPDFGDKGYKNDLFFGEPLPGPRSPSHDLLMPGFRDIGYNDDHYSFETLPPRLPSPEPISQTQKLLASNFPFLRYAATNVLHHANEAATGLKQEEFLTSFPLSTWIGVINQLESDSDRYTTNASLLYVLADNNCFRLIRTICHEGSYMGVRGEKHAYPICAAMKHGHREAVRALLDPTGELQVPEIKGRIFFGRAPKKDVPLWEWALLEGHEVIAEVLMQSGHFSDLPSPNRYQTAISFAIRRGYEKITKQLFPLPEIQRADDTFFSRALLDAVDAGSAKIIQLLLDERANIAFRGPHGDTAFLRAARLGKTSVMRLLLTHGADIEARDGDNDTALLRAARRGNESVVQLLLTNGADIEARNSSNYTSITLAAQEGQQSTVQRLMGHGAKCKAVDGSGRTLLSHASHWGWESITRDLLRKGVDLEAADRNGKTALMWASEKEGNTRVVQVLLDHGANVDATDSNGRTALMYAVQNELLTHPATSIPLSVKDGANVNVADCEDKTALSNTVSRSNSRNPALLLLKTGANIDATDREGKTALIHAASRSNSWGITSLLLEHNANIEVMDNENMTALMHAVREGDLHIISLLLEHNAKLEAVDDKGMTALMRAASEGESYIVSVLLEKHADLEAVDNEGMTALLHAASRGMPFTVSLLLKHGANFKATNKTGKTVWDLKKKHCWRTADALHRYWQDANAPKPDLLSPP